MLYYKKVDAIQFILSDEQKAKAKNHKAVFFEGGQVKHVGGSVYIVLLQQGESLIKIHEGQWLVKHIDGLWQIFWPDDFNRYFIKPDKSDQEILISPDPFLQKGYNQPTTLWKDSLMWMPLKPVVDWT